MKRTATAVPLFETGEDAAFEAKLRAFAREVAKRHRGRATDSGALILALRGYYRMWSLFERVPPLDDRAIGLALAEYDFVRTGRRERAA